MKKKILSILLCFLFLFCVGCDGGPSDGNSDVETPKSLDGVKVISKPSDYNFAEAVGDKASENYYNLFSAEILNQLYRVYEDFTNEEFVANEDLKTAIFKDLETDKGVSFNNYSVGNAYLFGSTSTDQYYVFDSLRYTIEKIETVKDESGNILSHAITINPDSAWNWNISNDATSKKIFFTSVVESGDGVVSGNTYTFEGLTSGWEELYNIYPDFKPSFGEYYFDTAIKEGDVTQYRNSPYYQATKGEEVSAKNFYQDALEYAVYLLVMGFDYDFSEQSNPNNALYDFDIKRTNGLVTDIEVGGWGASRISIGEALQKAKDAYAEIGTYIGITEEDKEEIIAFIKDVVIGEKAFAKNQFTVDFVEYTSAGGTQSLAGTQPEDTIFYRNYEKIIANVVDYACTEAPIGFDAEAMNNNGTKGKSLGLDSPYLASQITDYSGDYFFMSYEDESDDNMFQYIEAQEYQSIIFYPQDESIGQTISDIWLAFEYNTEIDGLEMLDSLTINVGLRYFNSEAGEFEYDGSTQIVVEKGHYDSFKMPDENWLLMGHSTKTASYYDLAIDKEIEIKTPFINNEIINPFATGETIGEFKSKYINGYDGTREYFKLNPSTSPTSVGSFGTLNPDKFSSKSGVAREQDVCDYIEIYFDVEKPTLETGNNYNFKVGLLQFLTL
ncbi:MAG: hypothetical protein E7375_00845 [Clostridiales bacterium]|nr:hypothetical protein [Clostridiales bacterium]